MQRWALPQFYAQMNYDAVHILRFIPHDVAKLHNKARKVEIAVIEAKDHLEKYHYRIFVSKRKQLGDSRGEVTV